MLTTFFWLVIGHFLCDYVFQSDTVAREKNADSETTLQEHVPWFYWMTAHAMTHAAAVMLITGNIGFALMEFGTHFAIDTMKCKGWYGIHVDQALHLLCKAFYVARMLGYFRIEGV